MSVCTLTRLSSTEILHQEFPIECIHCGRQSVTPIVDGIKVQGDELQLALACADCGKGWNATVANDPLRLSRKADRRAVPRGPSGQ